MMSQAPCKLLYMIISFNPPNNPIVGKIIFNISQMKRLKLRKIICYLVGGGAGVQNNAI